MKIVTNVSGVETPVLHVVNVGRVFVGCVWSVMSVIVSVFALVVRIGVINVYVVKNVRRNGGIVLAFAHLANVSIVGTVEIVGIVEIVIAFALVVWN